jgi:DNA-directed RNA polymerase subunit RPC12/RpoP
MTIAECRQCGKRFTYWAEHTDDGGSARERETADCPYCGAEYFAQMITGWFRSRPLTDEEERDYQTYQQNG